MNVLILHGWQGNEDDHWQTWLARRLGADYPQLPDPHRPRLDAWLAAIADRAPDLVVCHSLGCLLWLHHLARGGRQAPALLVAPPSEALDEPELAGFYPVPEVALAPGSRLVCSDDDPYCPDGAAARYGSRLGVPVDLLPGQGHLNVAAGYGPWPEAEAFCRGQESAIASSRIAPG